MFLESSRYHHVPKAQITKKDGQAVNVVKLRRLPLIEGNPTVIKGNDRLDVMAQRTYGDGTRFWHIADANSALHANELVKNSGDSIKVPQQ